VAAGFLFKGAASWPTALLILGAAVTAASFLSLAVTFAPEVEEEAAREYAEAAAQRRPAPQLAAATA
jgi:hypothetical protein